jgi:hypothetical protein
MGKFLPWLQERIRHWVKPATSTLISGLLSDLACSRTELLVENALLRQQLIVLNRQDKRPQLTNPDPFWLVLLSHFTRFWKPSLHNYSARYTLTLASRIVSLLLETEVAR